MSEAEYSSSSQGSGQPQKFDIIRWAHEQTTGTYDVVSNLTEAVQQARAKSGPLRDSTNMTREELEAHLKAQSSDTRAAIAEQNRAIDARLADFGARIDQAIQGLGRERERFEKDLDEMKGAIKADGKSTRVTLWTVGVATVLGIAAFNATVLSNMVASFESGKNTADAIAKAADQLRQAQELAAKVPAALPTPQAPK